MRFRTKSVQVSLDFAKVSLACSSVSVDMNHKVPLSRQKLMHQFAFDVTMNVVIRVGAETLEQAKEHLRKVQAVDLDVLVRGITGYQNQPLRITEGSVVEEKTVPWLLFELDGKPVKEGKQTDQSTR